MKRDNDLPISKMLLPDVVTYLLETYGEKYTLEEIDAQGDGYATPETQP